MRGSPSFDISRYKMTNQMTSQNSCGMKSGIWSCGMPRSAASARPDGRIAAPSNASAVPHPRKLRIMRAAARSGIPNPSSAPSLEYEQDQEGDRQAEQPGRLGQREAEEREGLHLGLRCRVARYRIDQRGKHVADADTGADERDAGETGADHLGGSEIHVRVPSEECDAASVQMQRVAQVKTGQDRE